MTTTQAAEWLYDNRAQLSKADIESFLHGFGRECTQVGIRIQRATQGKIKGANERLKAQRYWEMILSCEKSLTSIVEDSLSLCDGSCKFKERVKSELLGCAVSLPERIEHFTEVINAEETTLIMKKF
jgi:hypothetical protein